MPDESSGAFLSRPSDDYKESYIEAMREFHSVDGQAPVWHYERLQYNFDEFVEMCRSRTDNPPAGYVSQTEYWLIIDGKYAGDIRIRHYLNEKLREYGGHIGYRIRPAKRQQGYGTLQLALGLEKCRELGLRRVLITCDDDNIGSIRIIEANGGILENKINTSQNPRDILTRRYWIMLDT